MKTFPIIPLCLHPPLAQNVYVLLLQTELLDKSRVTTLIIGLEVTQVSAAIGHHLEKTATGMEILRILLEVLSELINLLGEERNLHIGRASVSFVYCNALYDRCLFLRGKHR